MNAPCPYLAGQATGDITPPIGTPLTGFAARGLHSSTGVYHPLRCVATALGDGTHDVLILAAELISFEGIEADVRAQISQLTGLPDAAIILCGSHTHCGPGLRDEPRFRQRHGWVDAEYRQRAIQTMAECARRAFAYRYPARLKFGTGSCDFAVSRRRPDPATPGRIGWGPYPEGEHDHTVSVLSIESAEGTIRGILFSYACHPTSRGGLLIGGDYPGFAFDRIQEVFDYAQPAFLQGCGADQKPKPADPAATGFVQRTLAETRDLGQQLGDAVIAVLQGGGMAEVSGPIVLKQSFFNLETEPLERAVLERTLESSPFDFARDWARHHLDGLAAGRPELRQVPMEVETLAFGRSLVLVALAAEAVAGYALRLKKELAGRFAQVLPFAYANSVIGYIPVRHQIASGGYEVEYANQYRFRTGPFVPETEDQLCRHVGAMLD